MDMSQKIRAIRKAEGLTQMKFSELTGIALSTLKNYEGEHTAPGLSTVLQITNHPKFEKYTLWLMTGKIAPESGQISPTLSPDGVDIKTSHHSDRKTG
ncbi:MULTISPECIES: helix-turn-helix domain-containing protein [Photorhabdus]|uniref:Helix-turn-helix transcriptional regulator n=2 Tax=Photorhabdus TaxID=29487 RepID=A0AAW6BI54_9GAMM|nr:MULTISPECIES: helix-turn-helix transcriptional regulator [Photorhabdus]KGM27590.1 repressor [Photorhabdus luminescens]AXG45019.1 XRE family transcriptional regulator [Photorhabdus laumondii subsp. laumondii]MBS9432230.1 XRE family transcriptional regulator [Photorhabdus hainanensis]MBS9436662.1 XRE family transcriptional regulator [Photorhabdus noenieputensis]MCK3669439.1 helix-turn-helix transcriptional regulator [Photorhabdus noenieputensis]